MGSKFSILKISLLSLILLLKLPLAHAEPNQAFIKSGEEVYKQICANCHEAGVAKAASSAMMSFMAPSAIYRALTNGVMMDVAADLSDTQKQAVVKYITGKGPFESQEKITARRCQGETAKFDISQPPEIIGWGFTPDNRREITDKLAGINPQNVKSLKLKWAFGFPQAVRARSHPATAAGAVFVGSQDGTLYALDQETGCIRWTYLADAEIRTGLVISKWKKNDPKAKSLIYFGDFLGSIYALDSFTGKQVWKMRPDDHPNATITATPTLFENTLYASISSLEVLNSLKADYECCTFRGSVIALNAMTGKPRWQSYTISQEAVPFKTNKVGTQQFGPSGAPIWNTPTIDAKRRQLYVGTGENYSSPATKTSDAILAFGLDDGELRWQFQATENDAWNASCSVEPRLSCPEEEGPDYDFGGQAVLAKDSNGKDYIVAGQKSGMVWALNPDNGELIWKNRVGRGGVIGGVHFGIAITGDKVIVPISDAVADPTYVDTYQGQPRPGLYALDLKTGDYLWQWSAVDICNGKPLCMKGNSAAPTATQSLAIAGSLDGYLRIHDIKTGSVLWEFDTTRTFESVSGIPATGGAMEGGAAALLHHGWLYVNSGYMFNQHMPGNAFFAFQVENDRK